jgi:hypothetical protein
MYSAPKVKWRLFPAVELHLMIKSGFIYSKSNKGAILKTVAANQTIFYITN